MRIVFMGSPDFAVPSLKGLVAAKYQVARVVCQPDKPKGRGRAVARCAIKVAAEELGLSVSCPPVVRGKSARPFLDEIEALAPDFVVVAAYGKILSTRLLRIPRIAPVNVHASILPRWRGASPIQHAVLAGDAEAGVAIMHMEAGLDTGGVYHLATTPVGPDETAGELSERLAEIGAAALLEALPGIADGSRQPAPQDEAQATEAPLLCKQDGQLDFTQPAEVLARRVRAMTPWPGAFTRLGGKLLKVYRVEVDARPPGEHEPGTVVDCSAALTVACGEGQLRILDLQLEGKRRMSAAEFLPGARVEPGALLGS